MQIRTAILLTLFILVLPAGWKYVYVPFSERAAAGAEVEEILASRVKEVLFTPLLPQKLPSGFYISAPEILQAGGEGSLRIQYAKRDGSVLDVYERAIKEGEDIALPFRNASNWEERKDIALKGNTIAYFVRGKDEKITLAVEGKLQEVTLQMAMLAFLYKGTRAVISNSAFLDGALLSEGELSGFANSMIPANANP